MTNMNLDVIFAFHNRSEKTTRAVRSFKSAAERAGVGVHFFAFDDGSTDGTSAALRDILPDVHIVQGDGTAYWARGMAESEQRAIQMGTGEYIFWLNDDVELDLDALSRLRSTLELNPSRIVACATREPGTGRTSYSGFRRRPPHPLRFNLVEPGSGTLAVDAFNGNLVAVPRRIAIAMGGIDGRFGHAFADVDYGLRAARLKIPVLLAPGTFGTCARNRPPLPQGLLHDWKKFLSPKGGGHPSSLYRYLRRHSPILWPVFFYGTYGLWWARRGLRITKG